MLGNNTSICYYIHTYLLSKLLLSQDTSEVPDEYSHIHASLTGAPGLRRSRVKRLRPFILWSAKSVATLEYQSACGTRSSTSVTMAGFLDARRFVIAILPIILKQTVFAAVDTNAGKKVDVVLYVFFENFFYSYSKRIKKYLLINTY